MISRYRPRSPSVSTSLMSMDVSQFNLFERPLFTQSDFNKYRVRSTFSLDRSGAVIGSPHAAKCQTANASNPNNRRKESLHRLGTPCHDDVFRNFLQRISACREIQKRLATAAEFLWIHLKIRQRQHRLLWSRRGQSDTTSKRLQIDDAQAYLSMILVIFPHIPQRLFLLGTALQRRFPTSRRPVGALYRQLITEFFDGSRVGVDVRRQENCLKQG